MEIESAIYMEEESIWTPKMPEICPRMSGANKRPRLHTTESCDSGIFDERILLLVFESIKWDIHALCATASVSRKLRAVANRLLWREVCVYRAPRMIEALTNGGSSSRIGGGWHALAKLLFFCCGCESTRHFQLSRSFPGHFVKASRFSKTSGRSFLTKKCRNDLLYVSDPCEHPRGNDTEDDLGIYRGVFRGFMKSRTRACLVARQVELEERVRCPFCGSRVWSMTTARLLPKTAAKRLGSQEGGLEYFVCVNGHVHGVCWLIHLSSDEGESTDREIDDDGYSDDDDGGDDGNCGPRNTGGADGIGRNGSIT